MVKKKLVAELIHDGVLLLDELDRRQFPVESMFWLHSLEEGYWRLIIGSEFAAQHGSMAAYRELQELLRGMELAGLLLEDISVLDPLSPQFRSAFSFVSGSTLLVANANWVEFEDAVVYRWIGASVTAELGCQVSTKELYGFWDAERKLLPGSHPALVIRKAGNRVTLRFHPQHGPLKGIESIKTVFAIALHRPEARPDCPIHWIS